MVTCAIVAMFCKCGVSVLASESSNGVPAVVDEVLLSVTAGGDGGAVSTVAAIIGTGGSSLTPENGIGSSMLTISLV